MLGENSQMFLCNPPRRMTLEGSQGSLTYKMYMDMSNTEIQAFGIKDGILSSDGRLF